MSIETMDAIELQREAEDYFNGFSYSSYLWELSARESEGQEDE